MRAEGMSQGLTRSPQTTLERAFELAGAGICQNIDDLRSRLRSEGRDDVDEHFGLLLVRRLEKVLEAGGGNRARPM